MLVGNNDFEQWEDKGVRIGLPDTEQTWLCDAVVV